MKKIISCLTVLLVCLALLPMTVSAASASATLEGPGTVRAGDTITLTFYLSGTGIQGASGTLRYDTNQLTLSSTAQKVGNGWAVEFNGNNFVAYDNNLTSPLNSKTAIFTATFKVKSGLATGTAINVSCADVIATDGADIKIGTVSYSKTIAAPKSTDNTLKSLTVSNATISPAFSASTTSYTASVPFSVSKLSLSAVANDSKASVSISNPNLTANGTTKVTITVTAESGAKKTYTITVTRAQDPNYVPSSNNNLSGIKVDGFLLSPVFSADNTKYVVWLPYETDKVTVSGTAADSKASVKVEGGSNLVAGTGNEIKVICTAENGEQKVYTVVAMRAAPHNTDATEPTEPPTEPPPTEPPTEPPTVAPTEEPTEPSAAPTEPQTPANSEESSGIPWWTLLVVGVICLAAGFAGGFIIKKK